MASKKSKKRSLFNDDNKFLLRLTLKNGKLLLDSENPDKSILTDLLYYVQSQGTSETEAEMQESCLHYSSPEDFVFSLPPFQNQRVETEIESTRLSKGVQLSESSQPCIACKQKKVVYYEKQTRSADEPMTIFYSCLNCGKNWRT